MRNLYVITGGSGGMGIEIAKKLGEKGTVLLADINEEKLTKAMNQLSLEGIKDVLIRKIDITNQAQVQELAYETSELGELSAIVHTAGLSPTMAESKKIMQVNLMGTSYILNAFLKYANPGTVAICLASMGGHMVPKSGEYVNVLKNTSNPNILEEMENFTQGYSSAAYSLSKLGVMLMVEEQAWEWGQKGARIVSISPGSFNTSMGKQEAEQQEEMASLLKNTPLGRFGEPTEIASLVNFLCSQDSAYITGTDIRIDGGTVANIQRLKNL